MAIRTTQIKVTTTGTDAAATGATNSNYAVCGKIKAIRINYSADAPDTTDVVITERVGTTDWQTIHTETNSKTDVMRYPRVAVNDNAESVVTYDGTNEIYEDYVVYGQIRVSVAGSDAITDCVIVDVIYEE
jgi:hypothetical protein